MMLSCGFESGDLLKMEGNSSRGMAKREKFLPEQGKIVFIKAQNEVKND